MTFRTQCAVLAQLCCGTTTATRTQGGAGPRRTGITGALPPLFVDLLLLPHGAPAPHNTVNTGAEALPPWQQQQQQQHPPWTQPGEPPHTACCRRPVDTPAPRTQSCRALQGVFSCLTDVLVVAHPSVCVVAGGLGGAVQPGGQAYVSRWDTGSREAGSRGRSRGSDSDRDWEPEERGHRAGREVPTASVFLKVQRRPVCACVAAATGAACVGVTDAV